MADLATLQADLVLHRTARDNALKSGQKVRVRGHEVELVGVEFLDRAIRRLENEIALVGRPGAPGVVAADVAKGWP